MLHISMKFLLNESDQIHIFLDWAKLKGSEEFWQLDISKKKFNYRQDAIETKNFFLQFLSQCVHQSELGTSSVAQYYSWCSGDWLVVHESLLKCNVLSWGEAEGAVPGASSRRRPKISSLDKLHFLFPHTQQHPATGSSCRAKIEMDMALNQVVLGGSTFWGCVVLQLCMYQERGTSDFLNPFYFILKVARSS